MLSHLVQVYEVGQVHSQELDETFLLRLFPFLYLGAAVRPSPLCMRQLRVPTRAAMQVHARGGVG